MEVIGFFVTNSLPIILSHVRDTRQSCHCQLCQSTAVSTMAVHITDGATKQELLLLCICPHVERIWGGITPKTFFSRYREKELFNCAGV